MIKEALAKIVSGNDLSRNEARGVMSEIMRGEATPAQIGSFLTGLRMKGETVEEIAGCAEAMRENAIPVKSRRNVLVDTCGTGGDSSGTFNISTTVAFVAAGAGLAMAKHGNRSISSKCGSADLLEALGVNIEINAEQIARCIDEIGIGFMFAPVHHPAMKHAMGPRKELGMRTIFNILGPLSNPAGAKRQLLGVYDPNLTEPMAKVLLALGSEEAFVVHGADGLDELSITGINRVSHLHNRHVVSYDLDPRELGLKKSTPDVLAGGTSQDNAAITRAIFNGEKGPKRDIVLLNAAAALVAGSKADNLQEGLSLAAQSIDSGRAFKKIGELVAMSQSFN